MATDAWDFGTAISICFFSIGFLLHSSVFTHRFGPDPLLPPKLILPCSSPRLLIIYNFHWSDRVSSIVPIRQFYLPYLQRSLKYPSDVVFYAPRAFPGLGILSNGLQDNGYFSIETFTVAYLSRSREYLGYLFLNDDGIIDPFLFNGHNFSKIALETAELQHGPSVNWGWYSNVLRPGRSGWMCLQSWFKDVCSSALTPFPALPMCANYTRTDRKYASRPVALRSA
jgi:hypothetical protein